MISPQLDEIRRLYSEAEYAIKRYERIALEEQVAAINELRYAGHHILAASKAEDAPEVESNIVEARIHCLRAVNDAKDAAIVSQLEFFEQFHDCRFAATELEKVIPDWKTCFSEISALQKKLATAAHRLTEAARAQDAQSPADQLGRPRRPGHGTGFVHRRGALRRSRRQEDALPARMTRKLARRQTHRPTPASSAASWGKGGRLPQNARNDA